MDIQEVIKKYFGNSFTVSFIEIKSGAINSTFHLTVDENGAKKEYILQKMKPIFDNSIMEDIKFITEYLLAKNFLIQKIVYTQNQENFVKDGTSWWRLLTYIPGKVFDTMPSIEHAREVGKLAGEFQNALSDCDYEFKFKLPHYHDTDFVMKRLENVLREKRGTEKYLKLKNTAENILVEYKNLPPGTSLPKRIVHGDLKLGNVLFDENSQKALTLIDLDTLMYSTVAIELGDALHFWCMRGGEDTDKVEFDLNVYNAALDGYFSTAKFLTSAEKNSIPNGVKLITLGLAARFVIDAFEENYFTLNSSKYKNLFSQNKKRAENLFEFFKKFSSN
jgi:Ser/Thr protein kinase RdoA (MazF antagonist)